MEAPRDLILMRHGRAESNEIKSLIENGRIDEIDEAALSRHSEDQPLTEEGEYIHARSAGLWVAQRLMVHEGLSPENYFTSTFTRAEQTAGTVGLQIEAAHPDVKVLWTRDRRLREVQTGRYGRHLDPAMAPPIQYGPIKRLYNRFGDGESIYDGMVRWRDFRLSRAAELAGRVSLIVAHGHFMGAVQLEVECPDASDDTALGNFETRDIANCNIIHYTSVDPDTKRQADRLRWVRAVVPYETEYGTSFDWQEFSPAKVSSADLLLQNAGFARLINQAVEFQQLTLFN